MRTIKYFIIFIIWIVFTNPGLANDRFEGALDSLDIYFAMHGRNGLRLNKIATELYDHVETIEDDTQLAKVKMYYAFGQFPSDSFKLFAELQSSLDIIENSSLPFAHRPLYHISYYHNKYGNQIARKNNLIKAIEAMIKYDKMDDYFYSFNCHITLSTCNIVLGNFEDALTAAIKAKEIASNAKNILYQLRAAINLSSIYGDLSIQNASYGSSYDRSKFEQQALTYFIEAYDISQEIGKPRDICLTSFNLGLYYSEEKEFEKSNIYLDECIELSKKNDLHYDFFTALEIKGENLIEMGFVKEGYQTLTIATESAKASLSKQVHIKGQFIQAKIEWHDNKKLQAIRTIEQIILTSSDYLRLQQRAHFLLHEWYKKTGNYKNALQHKEQWTAIKDSIANEKSISDFKLQSAKFQEIENEKKIVLLEKQKLEEHLAFNNKLTWYGGLLGFVILGSILYFIRLNNQRVNDKQKFTDLEQRLLRSQMNPHFTFNALSSIQNYLLKDGKSKQGALYLAKFAKLIRHILDQSIMSTITISEEIKVLENYLTLQKMRFNDTFSYSINIDEKIDPVHLLIPPMMIQPLVENAIEHGKIYAIKDGHVSIDISKSKEMIEICIEDNGLGFKVAKPISNDQKKMQALIIINDRIELLNKKQVGAKFIIDRTRDAKTIVKLILPLIEK